MKQPKYPAVEKVIAPTVLKILKNLTWGPKAPEISAFLLIQAKIRLTVGTGHKPPAQTVVDEVLVKQRNDASLKAIQRCKSASAETEKEAASTKELVQLATAISQAFELSQAGSNPLDRAEFYPFLTEKSGDMESSPEDAISLVLALDHFLKVFQKDTEKTWSTPQGALRLNGLCGELSFVILECVTEEKHYLTKSLGECAKALSRLQITYKDWKEGSLKKKILVGHNLTNGIQLMFSTQQKVEILRIKAKLLIARGNGNLPKALEAEVDTERKNVQKVSDALYKEQKAFCTAEAAKWTLQRNYLPEIYKDLQPLFAKALVPLVQSVDCTLDDYKTIQAAIADLTLAHYSDQRQLTNVLISAVFNKKRCILKKYTLARRSSIKAVGKQLVMQKKLNAVAAEDIKYIFIDNGNLYVHIDQGDEDLMTFIQSPQFTSSAYNAILLIRNMCYVLRKIHESGVIVGDIRPTAWYIHEHRTPKLHAFDFARVKDQIRKTRESIHGHVDFGKYDSPEKKDCNDDSSVLSEANDIYGLGMCISLVKTIAKECLEVVKATQKIETLVEKMTHYDPAKRPTAAEAYEMTDIFIGKLHNENEGLLAQAEGIQKMSRALDKARRDLDHAENAKVDDAKELAARFKVLETKEKFIVAKQKKMAQSASAMEARARYEEQLRPPDYWSTQTEKNWEIVAIPKNSNLFQVFRHVMVTDDPKSLNKGRDVVEKGDYTYLDLQAVWRIENPLLWRNYAVERKNIRETLVRRGIRAPKFIQRPKLEQAISHLPGANNLYKDINETYLIHGTGPDVILSIATSGTNERFTSAALFGKGAYFAEDSAKNDQYCRGDAILGAHPVLHGRLFPTHGEYAFPEYPYKCYYLIFCRILLGYMVRVRCDDAKNKVMSNIDFPEFPVFASSDERELSTIPGIENPSIIYHCLVAEKGGAIARFREICQFHSARVYPEYLMSYSRK